MTKEIQKYKKDIFLKFKKKLNIQENPSENDVLLINKTYKYINFIKKLPWLKFVWIWNSVSMNYSNKESDIDLFIITTYNSMWFNRIIITLLFQILWIRKTTKKHSQRFCLSFFATDKWLDFSEISLDKDYYLYFWIIYLKPILNYDNTYEIFLSSQKWIDITEYNYIIEKNKTYIKYSWKHKKVWFITNILNKIFKNIFLKKTLRSYEKIWKPFWIAINDNMLKFHKEDIRKDFIKNFDF